MMKETMNRLRRRTQDGYMSIQALSIVVLLLGTMLALVQLAASRINVSEQSKSLTDAVRTTDRTESLLFDKFNQSATNAPFGLNGTDIKSEGSDGSDIGGGLGQNTAITWSTDPVTKTVTMQASNDDSELVKVRPIRGTQFTETEVVDEAVIYKIPAGPRQAAPTPATETTPAGVYGLWGNPVSTWRDSDGWGSWFNGQIRDKAGAAGKGTWALYGGTASTWGPALTNQARFVSHNDDAKQPNGANVSRSTMTARFDDVVFRKLMNQVRNNSADCGGVRDAATLFSSNVAGNYQCHRTSGALTLGALNGTINNGAATSPVRTVVVKGDLVVKNDITLTNSQVHIYVEGDVKFESPTLANGSVLRLDNTFIYAPNGTCTTYQNGSISTQLQMKGALACQRIAIGPAVVNPPLTSSFVQWVEPWATQSTAAPYTSVVPSIGEPQNISKPKHVFFFERSGHVDQWTP